jgi:hypothetical protein
MSEIGGGLSSPGFFALPVTTVDFNAANTDTPIPVVPPAGYTRYIVNSVRIAGASASITTATFGMFSAAAGGGTAIVASGTALTITSASEGTNNNAQLLGVVNVQTNSWNLATLYFRVQTAQGSPATAKVAIILSLLS